MIEIENEQLEEVFCEILQNMVFMFGEPIGGLQDWPLLIGQPISVSMQFEGDQGKGSIFLATDEGLCPELAANMLALDPEDDAAVEQGKDALKELLNISCGHFLTTFAGTEAIFDLSIPVVTQLEKNQWDQHASEEGMVLFEVEEHPVMVKFGFEG